VARVERATRAGVLSVLAACVLCLAAIAPSTSIATPAYTAEHSAYRSHARFVVTYEGLGVWSTAYHSEPPNDGGDHDTNDAHDLGVQSWNLLFGQTVVVDRCGPRKAQPDRCSVLQGLSGATGATTAIGSIDHKHVDGLYGQLDMAARCTVRADTRPSDQVAASIGIAYSPKTRTIVVSASNPVSDVLLLLPTTCPGQADPIDGLSDNYFTPGFSFVTGYGPDRWFTSQKVRIPAKAFHHASRITVPLRDTPDGAPPADCAVPDPSIARCKTGGSWRGVLTFKAP